MAHTHTKIVFCAKDEPILDSIEKDFLLNKYSLKVNSDGRSRTIELTVDKYLQVLKEDMIMLDNYEAQFESIYHFTPTKSCKPFNN